MAIKDTDRKARANYKKKIEELRVELYPTDTDIKERIAERVEAGERKAAYIKRLIRDDLRTPLTDDKKAELYEALVTEAKSITADGLIPSRFEMLRILCDEWGVEISLDVLDLVDKLYRDGFAGA